MSTKVYKAPKLSVPKKAISIIGIISVENLKTVGLSASSGKEFLAESIASLMSAVALAKSIPQLNSTNTVDCPSFEVEVIVLMPLTVATEFSIILVTDFSTSSGPAFSYLV